MEKTVKGGIALRQRDKREGDAERQKEEEGNRTGRKFTTNRFQKPKEKSRSIINYEAAGFSVAASALSVVVEAGDSDILADESFVWGPGVPSRSFRVLSEDSGCTWLVAVVVVVAAAAAEET